MIFFNILDTSNIFVIWLYFPVGYKESDTVRTASEGLYLRLLEIQPSVVAPLIVSFLNDIPRQTMAISSAVNQSTAVGG